MSLEQLQIAKYIVAGPIIFVITFQLVEFAFTLCSRPRKYIPDVTPRPISIIVVAYLPNERSIIMATLNHYRDLVGSYEADCNITLAYNTPTEMDIEDDLEEFREENADWFYLVKVEESTSKAENVNYALSLPHIHPVVGIYDTDHRPRPGSFERACHWIYEQDFDYVQGRCVIRNEHSRILETLVRFDFDVMYPLFHQARYSMEKIALFGGSNGYWKRDEIRELGFRQEALTEDIDCSVRAVLRGLKGYFDIYLVSTEEAPTSLISLWNQRLRWSQGWSEVSLWYTLPILSSGEVNWWQKINFFLLFVFRELFTYFQIFGIPIFIVETIKAQEFVIDYYTFAVMLYSLVYYPILALCLFYSVERNEWYGNHAQLLISSLINMLVKCVWTPLLALQGHARHIVGLNKWQVTPREGTIMTMDEV